MLEDFLYLNKLFDFYGSLLTDRQRQCLQMYLCEDISLSEIADYFSISRQAASDIVKRSSNLLKKYESKLSLVQKQANRNIKLLSITEELEKVNAKLTDPQLQQITMDLHNLAAE